MATTLTTAFKQIGEINMGGWGYGDLYLQLYAKLISQDITQNTSTYMLYSRIRNSGYYMTSGNCYANIDNTNVKNNVNLSFPQGAIVDLGTKTITVTHNSEGKMENITKSANFTCYAYNNIYKTVTGTFNLPTIARASTATCTTANIGETAIISINRKSDTFTHTLTYKFGDLSGIIKEKTTGTSISWDIPTTFYSQIPKDIQGTGTLNCTTYSGNTQIGNTQTSNFYVSVNKHNNKPNVTISAVDNGKQLPTGVTTTSLTGSALKIIKGYSDVNVAAKSAAQNSAWIASNSITCSDGQYSSSLNTTFTNVNSNTFTINSTDSRGISNSASTSLEIINYTNISTTEFILKRITQTSTIIKLSIRGTYFNGSFGSVTNDISLKYRYRVAGGTWSAYTDLSLTKSNGTFSYANDEFGDNFNYQTAYEFEFVLTDQVNIYTLRSNAITKGVPIVDYGENDFRVNGRLKANTYFSDIIHPASWYHIGRIRFESQGQYAILNCYTGNGQNGNAYQNTHARILLKQGYTGNNLPIGVTTKFTQNYNSNIKVKIKHISQTECDVYIFLPFDYNDLTYTIDGSYSDFSKSNEPLDSEPSTDKESTYYIHYQPEVLYDNSEGTTGTVTLSQSAANFNYLEIYFKRDANTGFWGSHFYKSVKISNPDGKNIAIDLSFPAEVNLTQVCTKIVAISGTTITVKRECYGNIKENAVSEVGTQEHLYITKVIGYN